MAAGGVMLSMQKTILILASLFIGAILVGSAPNAAASAGGADAAKSGKPAPLLRPDPGLPLKKGMTAQDVKARWGDPSSVEPFPSAEGKAEVWTYYYTLSDQTTEVVTSTAMQSTFRGPVQGMGDVPQLVYGLKHSEVKQVVKLLLYDGELVNWKKSIERKETLQ